MKTITSTYNPETHQLVPKVLTPEMKTAAIREFTLPRIWDALLAAAPQVAQREALNQALTDPENQPNQYGVEFLMHGPRMAFRVGSQKFTLAYEPTEPGEFEFMRDMLISAFSTFTPDVKTAQRQPLTEEQEREAFERELRQQCFQRPTPEAHDLAWCMWKARAMQANNVQGEKR